MERRVIWVTWETQLRNRSMTDRLGIPLFAVVSHNARLLRYLSSATRTLWIILRERPLVVVCQNPSMVLALWLLVLRPLLGFKLAIDAHYGGVTPWTGNRFLQRILDKLNRAADLVIVTTQAHAAHVRALGGRAFVCPDPLPELASDRGGESTVHKKVLLISSFDLDEPYREALAAASIMASDGFHLSVSGNFRRAGIDPGELPQVEFLGFVPEEEYYRQLFTSEVVIDLTDVDNCLVCGAYEALSAGKPTVLSRQPALEEYFTGGTVFTKNRAPEIARAVKEAHDRRTSLGNEACEWVFKEGRNVVERLSRLKRTLFDL